MFNAGDKVLYVPEGKFGEIVSFYAKVGGANVYNVRFEYQGVSAIYEHNLLKLPEEPELTVEAAVKFLKDCGFKVTLESL